MPPPKPTPKHLMPVRPPDGATVLTAQQVAWVLGCSVPTVRRLIKRGELVAFKVGQVVRVRREDLDEYVERCALVSSPHDCP
jgi:excisionase family DNA binding protein